jgi:hypothetical protein
VFQSLKHSQNLLAALASAEKRNGRGISKRTHGRSNPAQSFVAVTDDFRRSVDYLISSESPG